MRTRSSQPFSTTAQLSVSDVARRLEITPARVRAMIAAGIIDAVKVGGRWLIDPESVRRRAQSGPPAGRPFSVAKAWGLLMVVAGERPGWLSPSDLSRVRRRLREEGLVALVPRLRNRAAVHRLRAHPSDIKRIAAHDAVVRTGASAAMDYGLDLIAPQQVECYLPHSHLQRLTKHYALQPGKQPNVLLRVVGDPWPFNRGTVAAPASVVGVDLMESDDARSQRAGRQLLEQVEATWST